MRPIKLRAWHFSEKKMFYNVYLYPWNMVVDENDKLIGYLWIDVYLMQSTWALDKKWVEIYDGDIVAGERRQFINLEPCVVFYDKFKLWFYAKLARNWEDWFCWKTGSRREYMVEQKHKVVIGNIYENSELVNV